MAKKELSGSDPGFRPGCAWEGFQGSNRADVLELIGNGRFSIVQTKIKNITGIDPLPDRILEDKEDG